MMQDSTSGFGSSEHQSAQKTTFVREDAEEGDDRKRKQARPANIFCCWGSKGTEMLRSQLEAASLQADLEKKHQHESEVLGKWIWADCPTIPKSIDSKKKVRLLGNFVTYQASLSSLGMGNLLTALSQEGQMESLKKMQDCGFLAT